MLDDVIYIIGQGLGVVAVVLGFICFQMKTARRILVCQIVTALVFSLHYLLIGAMTAVGLNLLAAVKCLVYYFRDKRGSKSMVLPIFFAVLVVITGVLTWEGWYSMFLMIGLVIGAISLAFSNAQNIRVAMFFKSPCCLFYNLIVASGGGVIYECASLVSSIIGIIKNRSQKGMENGNI